MSAKLRSSTTSASLTQHSALNTQHFARAGTVLAFDFGEKRIGVAVGDLAIGIAHPLTTITALDNRARFAAIAALIEEWHPMRLIVGVPTHPDGAVHEMGRLARRFAQRLEGRFGVLTRLIDERLTSRAAEMRLREQGARGRKLKARLDTVAAQEILQAYFEASRRETGSEAACRTPDQVRGKLNGPAGC